MFLPEGQVEVAQFFSTGTPSVNLSLHIFEYESRVFWAGFCALAREHLRIRKKWPVLQKIY